MHYIPFTKFHKEAIQKTEMFIRAQFECTNKELYANSKSHEVVEVRYVAYFILSRVFSFPSTLIGELFKKDHSSVLYGIKQVIAWKWDEESLNQFYKIFPYTKRSHKPYNLSPD